MLEKKYVTVREASDIIGCSVGNVRHMILDNRLKAEKLGSYWVIEKKQAEKAAKTPAKTGRPRKFQK